MSHPAAVLFAVALTASLFLRPGLRTRTIFFSSLIGLMLALISDSPVRIVGDGIECAAMANNLSHSCEAEPDGQNSFSLRGTLVSGAADAQLEKPWLRGSDRRQDFPHFWLYSLLAAPFVRLADLLGANPLTGFTMLNVILLIALAALLVGAGRRPRLRFSWWPDRSSGGADKAHTEVFTSVMLATALVLLRTSPWWSILAAGLAAGQNPALLIAAIAIMARCDVTRAGAIGESGWRQSPRSPVAAAHPLYYYSRLGVWTGMYDSVDRHLPSFRELIAVLLDVNLGVLIHDPLLFAACRHREASRPSPRPKRKPFDVVDGAIAFIALALIVVFTQTTNVNSGGTPGPSRVRALAGAVCHSDRRRRATRCVMVSCVVRRRDGLVRVWSFAPSLPDQYLKPSALRRGSVDSMAGSRQSGGGSLCRADDRESGRHGRRWRAAAARRSCSSETEPARPGRQDVRPRHCPTSARRSRRLRASQPHGGRLPLRAGAAHTGMAIRGAASDHARRNDGMLLPIAQTAETPCRWQRGKARAESYTERLDQPNTDPVSQQWRWIQERAEIGIMTEARTAVRLKITARSANRPRRLRVPAGSSEIATLAIQTKIGEYQTESTRAAGGNERDDPGESRAGRVARFGRPAPAPVLRCFESRSWRRCTRRPAL